VNQEKASNKQSDLKDLYQEWVALKSATVTGYDDETGLILADDEFWEDWCSVS
jgi:hypothetical protein